MATREEGSMRRGSAKNEAGLGPFLRGLEERLDQLDHGALVAAVIEHGRRLPAVERSAFLAAFDRPVPKGAAGESDRSISLIVDVRAFVAKLEAGDYVEDFGWDPEIRDKRSFGDESWADEMDSYFAAADDAFLEGDLVTAAEVYGLLLDAFMLDEAFCGASAPDEMIQTPLGEAKARYLRALYEVTPTADRPRELWDRMRSLRLVGPAVCLQDLFDASPGELPGLDQFIGPWRVLLAEDDDRAGGQEADEHDGGRFPFDVDREHRRLLLREVVRRVSGMDGLAELARSEGHRHPEAWQEWVAALEEKGDAAQAVKVAREAIGCITDPAARAGMADVLARLALDGGQASLAIEAREAAWTADPTLDRLLALAACESSSGAELSGRLERAAAAARANKTAGRERLRLFAQLVAGDLEAVLQYTERVEDLGWSGAGHPGSIAFPFLLVASAGTAGCPAGSLAEGLWFRIPTAVDPDGWYRQYLAPDARVAPEAVLARRDAALGLLSRALGRTPPDANLRARLLERAKKLATERATAIVQGRHNGAYERAAEIVVACGEAIAQAGAAAAGRSFVQSIRDTFPRHYGFRREVEKAIGRSPILAQDATTTRSRILPR